ncbi:thioredoxin domain-containing protein [Patescibacteria group bacterium]|nr:thioredoxin domain-containing protein [Patescibacteria group bacterium]
MAEHNNSNNTSSNVFTERYLTPIAVLLGAVILAGALVYGHGKIAPNQPSSGDTGQQAVAVDIQKVKMDGGPYIGNASAPVTMAVWFDYQCPYCKQLDQTVITQLNTNYVQAGKLKIVFKDFQFLGERSPIAGRDDSTTAAEFGRAMWEVYPSQYYPWLTAMFNAQDDENSGFGDLASIQKLTAGIPGVDVAKVTALMTQKKAQYDTAIAADRTEGAAFGIQGTPSIIVGTTLLQGGQSYPTVSAAVDALLKK